MNQIEQMRLALISAKVALQFPEPPCEKTRIRTLLEITQALDRDPIDRLFAAAERIAAIDAEDRDS